MAPPQSPEEIEKLMNFIAEKSKEVKFPMSISRLSREFQTEAGSMLSKRALDGRIRTYREKISKMKKFDINTRVRMMFAVSSSVDAVFLEELKKQADVKLDRERRIIKYKSNDGSLELEGDHSLSAKLQTVLSPISSQEIGEMMNFIAEKSKYVKCPMSMRKLSRDFQTEAGSTVSKAALDGRMRRCRDKIPQMDGFDINTKVKMMFALSASADAKFLIELKKHADVELDEARRIVRYEANDGSLVLECGHSQLAKQKAAHFTPVPSEEKARLMRFIADKSKDVKFPMSITRLCREFQTETGSTVLEHSLLSRIQTYRQGISQMKEFDINTKVKMMFAVSAPAEQGFLAELKQQAQVEVDTNRRITKYKSNDGSLDLEGDHSDSAKRKSYRFKATPSEEIAELMRFVAAKSKNVEHPMFIGRLSRMFQTETGSMLSTEALLGRIQKYRHEIPQMQEFDTNTKIKMMFTLSASVDAKFLIKLKQEADIDVDDCGRITKYKSNDGSLELEGGHSLSAKKSHLANKKKARVDSESSKLGDGDSSEGSPSDEEEDSESLTMSWATRMKRKSIDRSATSSPTGRRGKVNETAKSRNRSSLSRGRKRARNSRTSSVEEGEEDPMSDEDAFSMNHRNVNRDDDDFDYHLPTNYQSSIEQNPERIIENVPMEEEKQQSGNSVINATTAELVPPNNDQNESPMEQIPEKQTENVQEVGDKLIEEAIEEHDQSLERQKQMILDGIPVKQERVDLVDDAPTVRPEEEPSIATRDLLVALRGPTATIRSPLIEDLLTNIEQKIRTLELENKRFPLQKVSIPFNAFLYVLTENAVAQCPPEEDSTSLRDFLICLSLTLRAGISFIRHPSMDSFNQELDTLIQELTTQDKQVRLDVVHRAVSIAFLTIAP